MKAFAVFLGVIGLLLAANSSAQFVLFPVADQSNSGHPGALGICLGPDGNIWFTLGNRVGRMTPDGGTLTEFELPTPGSRPGEIVAGPDGNLWFLEGAVRRVGRITPAGVITEYPIPAVDARPGSIVAGPDGAIWFTDITRGSIWRVSLSGSFTEYLASPSPYGLTVGSDENLWFTTFFGLQPRRIGRMTLSGALTLFSRPSIRFGQRCALGPDGNVWYAGADCFGRVTPSGVITEFLLAGDHGHVTTSVAAGPDGNLWMPVDESFQCIPPCQIPVERDAILRVSTTGVQTRYELGEILISDGSRITAGPAGSVWFSARFGLVRFYPEELEGLTAPADIPTIGDFGRVALVGLLALAGYSLLRR